jgi:hypothetical protein
LSAKAQDARTSAVTNAATTASRLHSRREFTEPSNCGPELVVGPQPRTGAATAAATHVYTTGAVLNSPAIDMDPKWRWT